MRDLEFKKCQLCCHEDLGPGFSEQSLSLPTSQSGTKLISLVDFGRFFSSSFVHLGVPRNPERLFTFTPFHNSCFGPNTVSFRHNKDNKTLLATTNPKQNETSARAGHWGARPPLEMNVWIGRLAGTFGWLGVRRIERIFTGQMPPKSSCFQIGCLGNGSTFKSVLLIAASFHHQK